MNKIGQVIVVEGKHDIDFLQTFLDADFIKTDGTSLPQNTKDLLIELAKQGREIIVLTDPDSPGERIRKEIQSIVPSCKHAFIRAKNSRWKHKIGVEHTTKDEVLSALENLINFDESHGTITQINFYELGLVGRPRSQELRTYLCDKFHLGHGSAKTVLKRLNMLRISLDELKKAVEEFV